MTGYFLGRNARGSGEIYRPLKQLYHILPVPVKGTNVALQQNALTRKTETQKQSCSTESPEP